MTQVCRQSLDDRRRPFDLSDDGVARAAQQSSNAPRVVAVVDHQRSVQRVAQETATVLGRAHLINLGRREPVLAHQSSADVFLSRSLRVGPAPLAQPFVPTISIRLAVLAVALARAVSADLPLNAPRGELLGRQSALARLARNRHASIIAPTGDTSTPLDEPCHADVLLELANAAVSPSEVRTPRCSGTSVLVLVAPNTWATAADWTDWEGPRGNSIEEELAYIEEELRGG